MNALAATAASVHWAKNEGTPLSRTMTDFTIRMVRRIVVRTPIVALLHETTRMSERGLVHEVFARTGFLLRSPTTILGLRRPSVPPTSRQDPSTEPPRRA